MKKIMLIACTALLALNLVGCKGGEAKSKAKKPLNISVFTIQQRQQPPADNKSTNGWKRTTV
jgi:putative aldouronate transport system substrate-binding protein